MPAYKDKKRGTWYANFYYQDWTGERKHKIKRGFKLQREALDYEREFLSKEKMSSDMSFQSLTDLYFEDMKTRLRETTIDNKRYLFDGKILPFFKDMPINKIRAAQIRKWQNELINHEDNYSPTYLKSINNQLSAIMNYAVKYYGLPNNPCHISGSMGKKNASEMNIWTVDEFNQFITKVDKPAIRLAFMVMFWSGLRVGECLALTPNDVINNTIDVNKSTSRKDGEDKIYDPKTTKSARIVPIPDFLTDEIQSYINSTYMMENTDKIFYFTKSALNKSLDQFAAIAKVKRIRVHDLRHSHASLLIDMGEDILLISKRLGHEKVDTTWNTYGHLYPDRGIKLAENLQKLKNGE